MAVQHVQTPSADRGAESPRYSGGADGVGSAHLEAIGERPPKRIENHPLFWAAVVLSLLHQLMGLWRPAGLVLKYLSPCRHFGFKFPVWAPLQLSFHASTMPASMVQLVFPDDKRREGCRSGAEAFACSILCGESLRRPRRNRFMRPEACRQHAATTAWTRSDYAVTESGTQPLEGLDTAVH